MRQLIAQIQPSLKIKLLGFGASEQGARPGSADRGAKTGSCAKQLRLWSEQGDPLWVVGFGRELPAASVIVASGLARPTLPWNGGRQRFAIGQLSGWQNRIIGLVIDHADRGALSSGLTRGLSGDCRKL